MLSLCESERGLFKQLHMDRAQSHIPCPVELAVHLSGGGIDHKMYKNLSFLRYWAKLPISEIQCSAIELKEFNFFFIMKSFEFRKNNERNGWNADE